MLFTSYSFLMFLLIVFVLYYIIPKKAQWPLLLAASYFFYYFSGVENLLYIVFTTVTTYALTMVMQKKTDEQQAYLAEHKEELSKEEKKEYKSKIKKSRFRILVLTLVLNIGMLAVVKYTNFAIYNVNECLRVFGSETQLSFMDIALPMGISFYVFQSMGYAIDVYREKHPAEKNFFKLALFVSFFPQLIQGPISRFDELATSLYEKHAFDKNTVAAGLQRILWGYFKKLVIADRIVVAVSTLVDNPTQYDGAWVFVGMMFYAFELYADFTGGIDITIGVAQALGIRVTENFRRPYFSKNIREYWQRWHITMGRWFTDYIFYPISVCQPMLRLTRFAKSHFGEQIGKRVVVYLSSFIVWLATGIWHGASWNFVVWGLANFVVIMVSRELEPLYRRFHEKFSIGNTKGWSVFQIIRTIFIMSSLRTFDCYENVALTFKMYFTMFTKFNWGEVFSAKFLELGLNIVDYIVLMIGLLVLLAVSLFQEKKGSVREHVATLPYPIRCGIWFGLFVLVLLWGAYGIGYDASQFIYNQF